MLDEMRGFGESHLFEVIVVDDASDDGDTRSVLSEIERSFSDVLLIRKKVNGGVSASRNAGAYYARGDWLSFLDGDDVWVEGRAQIFRKALEAYEDSNWISSDYSRMEFNGSILAGDPLRHQRISQLLEAKNGITTVSLPKPVAFAVESFLCHINSTMIKRSLFISVGGFDVDFRTAEGS